MTPVVVHAAGSSRALGRAQGEGTAAEVDAALSFYERLAVATGNDFSVAAAAAGPYLDAAQRHLPHLMKEMEGLAEGSRSDLEAIAVLNCMEEVWSWRSEACTTMTTGRFLIHAEQWYAGHSQIGIVVAIPDDAPAFVSPTCAGFLPAVGMNAAGFAQGIDSLSAAGDGVGIPRVFVSRHALGARSLSDAAAAAAIPNRAGGYAHVLAGSGRAVVVETTAQDSAVLDGGGAHTNHYLSGLSGGDPASAGSLSRLGRAGELLDQRPPTTLEDCAALLADHEGDPQSICVHEEGLSGSATVFGMVCDLDTGAMLVSNGSPCGDDWIEVSVPGYERAPAQMTGEDRGAARVV